MTLRRAAVFFDRDGVLNEAVVRDGRPFPPADVSELKVGPGVLNGVAQLQAAGFVLLGVTNQPDVARRTTSRRAVEEINSALLSSMPLDEILVCYHDDVDRCGCRKPQPGLIHSAEQKYGVDLSRSFLIGDRWRDVEAGRRAGCKTVFLDCGYDEKRPSPPADFTTSRFSEAIDWILSVSRTFRQGVSR
jgi:D-glycero-D-manno-heptose 1,7-bisphosphate phosphatase